ncbi:hypothetical protein V6N13_068660 [Hibiscus sabdariffa]
MSSKILATHVFLGGCPPDDAKPDDLLSVRESSSTGETKLESSPILLVMEAPIVTPSSHNSGSTPVGLQTSSEGFSSNSTGVSYATMVAKNLHNIPGPGGDIVQDKDNCARNTSTAPLSDVMPVAEDPPVSEPTAATPYGSWMVVDTRRRRPPPRQANPPKRVVSNASHEIKASSTRFSILAGNDDHGGSESTAFNPIAGAKAHNSISVGKANGENIEVVPHVVNQQSDKHAAVAIVENVPRKAGLVGGKVTKQRGIVGRNLSDARRGLPIRKSTEVRLSNATNVSSWVQDLAQQLSAAKSIGCSSHGLLGVSSELSDKERSVSASGDGLAVDTG